MIGTHTPPHTQCILSLTRVGVLRSLAGDPWHSSEGADPISPRDGFPKRLAELFTLQLLVDLNVDRLCYSMRGQASEVTHLLTRSLYQKLTATNSSKLILSSLLVSPLMKVSMISRTLYPGREKLASLNSSCSSKSLTKPLLSMSEHTEKHTHTHTHRSSESICLTNINLKLMGSVFMGAHRW